MIPCRGALARLTQATRRSQRFAKCRGSRKRATRARPPARPATTLRAQANDHESHRGSDQGAKRSERAPGQEHQRPPKHTVEGRNDQEPE